MVYLELDFSLGSGNWCQVPFNFSSMFGIITITARVDSSKLYFTATTTNGSGFGPMTLNFAYKIFRNDLGL